jgi:DNA-binding Lrp family transcriptional regulator
MDIDSKDEKILNVLLDDAKLSLRQLAKKVNLSVATVMNRVRRLESEGIIKKYTVALDYDKIGFDVPVLIDVRVAKGKLFQVEKKVAIHPNVVAVYDRTGTFDCTIVAKFKNRKSMDNFLKKIQTFDFVERTETQLVLHTIKEEAIKL